jgi:hypothetical protein
MNDSEPCTSRKMALNSRPANSPCFDGGGGVFYMYEVNYINCYEVVHAISSL